MATTQREARPARGSSRRGTLSKWGVVLTIASVILSIANTTHCDADANALDTNENDLTELPALRQYPAYGGGGCPLCDSSVYSYCAQKVFHDSCCCDFPGAYSKPPQCYYNDCSLLYAKSCYEHSLIKNCCCNSPY